MLRDFLYIYEPIKVVINSLKSKAFKNKDFILTDIEIIYFKYNFYICKSYYKASSREISDYILYYTRGI
jgi:hypothetical protein